MFGFDFRQEQVAASVIAAISEHRGRGMRAFSPKVIFCG